jgi:hypothetical protein
VSQKTLNFVDAFVVVVKMQLQDVPMISNVVVYVTKMKLLYGMTAFYRRRNQ